MPMSNVTTEWVDGNLYFYDKSKNVIMYWDGTNRALNIPAGSTLTVGSTSIGPVNALAADGAISSVWGSVPITKTSACAATLADPTTGTDDGKRLLILAVSNYAHTIDNSAGSGFNAAGATADVITFGLGGAAVELLAYLGKWYIVGGYNYSLA